MTTTAESEVEKISHETSAIDSDASFMRGLEE